MSKDTAIYYITKSNILLITRKNGLQKLDIKPFVVNQEVLDLNIFIKSLSKFISVLNVRKAKALILVDQSLTYDKEVEAKEVTQEILEQFSQELPFDAKELEIANIKRENKNILIATNKYIYQSLIEALRQNNSEVESVLPAKYVSLHEADIQTSNYNDLLAKIATVITEEISFKKDPINISEKVQVTPKTPDTDLPEPKSDQAKTDPEQPATDKPRAIIKYVLFSLGFLLVMIIAILIATKTLTR